MIVGSDAEGLHNSDAPRWTRVLQIGTRVTEPVA